MGALRSHLDAVAHETVGTRERHPTDVVLAGGSRTTQPPEWRDAVGCRAGEEAC
jgi:hypothetical protein